MCQGVGWFTVYLSIRWNRDRGPLSVLPRYVNGGVNTS